VQRLPRFVTVTEPSVTDPASFVRLTVRTLRPCFRVWLGSLAQALERYERKNNLAMTAHVRDRLAELQDAAPR
jgi:hypothetical protein